MRGGGTILFFKTYTNYDLPEKNKPQRRKGRKVVAVTREKFLHFLRLCGEINLFRQTRMRNYLARYLFPIFSLIGLLLGTAVSLSAYQSGITMSAQAGFDGFYRSGQWIPVYVTLANNGAPVDGKVQIVINPDSSDRLVYEAPVSLPTQSKKLVTLYVQAPRVANKLTVEFLAEQDAVVAETKTNTLLPLLPDVLLYGVVTPEPGAFGFLESVTGTYQDAKVAFLSLETLPETAVPWANLDVLIIHDSDTGQLTPGQREALQAWLDTGGQLVLAGGPGWQKSTAAFTEQLPVAISGSGSVDDLPALSQAAGIPFREAGPYVMTNSSLVRGELLAHQDGLPLLARQPYGRGALYFLALDPTLAPLQGWAGSELLWANIVGAVPGKTLWGAGPQSGYSARNAAKNLPSVSLPSAWQLGGLLLFYIVVIGPVNYIILKRRRKLERAWLTIPLLVLVFSGIAYLVGRQIRGTTEIINQMSVAYSHAEGDYARVYTLLGLFAPQRSTSDLLFADGALARPFDADFGSGLTGNGRINAIQFGSDLTISGIRLDTAEIQTFIAENSAPAIDLSGDAVLNIQNNSLMLDVVVQNNSDITLETASLLFGTKSFELGDLAPGQSAEISRIVGTETAGGVPAVSPVQPGYAPLSNNVAAILGTYDYYNDRVLYGRYQFLEALDGSNGSSDNLPLSDDAVYLLAWANTPQIDVNTARGNAERSATTLYFVELPLGQNILSGTHISLPAALLHWQVLANSGVYEPAIENLYLNQGWVELEYVPWRDFQAMQIDEMALVLEAPDSDTTAVLPDVRLWNWQRDIWDNIEAAWGETAVADPAPYIGPNNTVRIRLEDRNPYYDKTLDIVYPLLTGDLE